MKRTLIVHFLSWRMGDTHMFKHFKPINLTSFIGCFLCGKYLKAVTILYLLAENMLSDKLRVITTWCRLSRHIQVGTKGRALIGCWAAVPN